MKAEILCVGTEILLGDIVNTNAAYIAKELAGIGIDVYYQSVVGDNDGRLKEALSLAFTRADTVILTGGLGPTYDDLTKEAVAAYFGKKMVMHEPSLKQIEGFFKKYGVEMTENNKKQALMPEGATVFPNEYGTAPGLAITDGQRTAVLLPGPPKEMKPMFDKSVIPYLMQYADKVLYSRNIRLFGIGESSVEDRLYDLMTKSKNPTVAPYAKMGEVMLRVTAAAKTEEEAKKLLGPTIVKIEDVLGEFIYGIDVDSLQEALVLELKAKGLKIATAESCTGGLLSARITEIPGSSNVFDCGVCTYSNIMKQKILNVSSKTLKDFGAVSEQTAAEMAKGVREFAGADIGIATTGIAGPDGGTEEKPVGTVFVGINSDQKTEVLALSLRWRDNADRRKTIRNMSASHALYLALKTAKLY